MHTANGFPASARSLIVASLFLVLTALAEPAFAARQALVMGNNAYPGNELRSAVNHAAVARVLRKPWRDDDLLEAVRHCVQLRRLQMENAQLSDQVSAQRRQPSQQEGSLRHYRELHSAGAALSFPSDHPDQELS